MNPVFALLLGIFLSGLPGGHGQLPHASPSTQVHVHSPGTALLLDGLIRLDVTVTDASGQPVSGLTRDDFTLLDNEHPQPIQAFAPASGQSHPRVSVLLLIDTLDLAPKLAALERQQAEQFLRSHHGELANLVTLCSLSNSGFSVLSEPSFDGNALADLLESGKEGPMLLGAHIPGLAMNLPGPRTFNPYANMKVSRGMENPPPQSLYNPDYRKFPPLSGMQALAILAATQDRFPGRKLLLWIGPGLSQFGTGAYPDQPYIPLADREHGKPRRYGPPDIDRQTLFGLNLWFSTLLRQARITLDVFSVEEANPNHPSTKTAQRWRDSLGGVSIASEVSPMDLYKKVLALRSGGRVLPPGNNIAAQIEQCIRQASGFYSLTFDPPPAAHADEYHSIAIRLSRPGLSARTTAGYYDQPFYSDPPNPGIRPITVAGLERMIHSNARHAAHEFPSLRLTQRLSLARLDALSAKLHGKKARYALLALADQADFLPPPPADVLAEPPPSPAEQMQMLAATSDFLSRRLPLLPNFFARRRTLFFQEIPGFHMLSTNIRAEPLHFREESEATILYRHGAEVVEAPHSRGKARNGQKLNSYGSFGALLRIIRQAIGARGSISWSHWERGADGRLAVFSYQVPPSTSRYWVRGCCLAGLGGSVSYLTFPGSHGNFAIDPASGAILRLSVVADLQHFVPANHSDMAVDYGPIVIGGKSYIVPLHSVTLLRTRSVPSLFAWNQSFQTWGPYSTLIDDFTFDHYHMFRPSIQILPNYTPVEKNKHHRR